MENQNATREELAIELTNLEKQHIKDIIREVKEMEAENERSSPMKVSAKVEERQPKWLELCDASVKNLAELEGALVTLEEKVDFVLTLLPPASEEAKQTPELLGSTLVARLSEIVDGIRKRTQFVERLIGRVDV